MNGAPRIAYFSMEIGVDPAIPTYSGGLGVLAGDTIRTAADLGVPLVGVTLLQEKGYFFQRLGPDGRQLEEPVEWPVNDFLAPVPTTVTVTIGGRRVVVRAWRYEVVGIAGARVPVYFLDTNVAENDPADRALTSYLYGGDDRYRLAQEVVLGIGGVRLLHALGFHALERFHMNEGHAALLTLELWERLRQAEPAGAHESQVQAVREQCVFTTHTPVPAGHDQYPLDLVREVLPHRALEEAPELVLLNGTLNMTSLGMAFSRYINGVAERHGEISRSMFPAYAIDSIANGVHSVTWTAEPFQELYDRRIGGWRRDSFSLRHALGIPNEEIWAAHLAAKQHLLQVVNRATNTGMDVDVCTVAFARRATEYKRLDLLFRDPERLAKMAEQAGPLQIVCAGKAHPKDEGGKAQIRRIFEARETLKGRVRVAYLENYDMGLGKLITAGADLWLNTPRCPREASGTSGMKAAHNGVPSLSVLDGWWVEGCLEGVTGWAIGQGCGDQEGNDEADAASMYDKLEHVILPMFYQRRGEFMGVMRHAIAFNASFFNTHRMMQEYVLNAYLY